MFRFGRRVASILAAALICSALHAQVQQTWVAKYLDPTTNDDVGSEVAVLPNGNLIVAG